MKVLVVTGIFPPDLGGPASYVPAIADALVSNSDSILGVITLTDSFDHNDTCYPFPIIRIKRQQFKPIRIIKTIFKIASLSRNVDVVFLNGLVLEGVIGSKLIARRPTVIKVVGDLIWEKARNSGLNSIDLDSFNIKQPSFKWAVLHKLQGIYTSYADAVITPSKYLSSIVKGWGVKPERIRVVYNAIKPALLNGKTENIFDLVTVARLVPWKGVEDLIYLASELNLSLRVVGDGPMRRELEALAIDLGARVSFSGNLPKELVFEEIANASIFVLNSSYEGLPHIVLEAKMVGVPVIATNAGGTPETISHGVDGLIVPVGSRSSLKSAIVRLLSDESLRTTLAEFAKKQVLTNFSFQKMVDETRCILRSVIGG